MTNSEHQTARPLLEGARRFLGRLFGHKPMDYRQALQNYSHALATTPLDLDSILQRLLDQIEPVAHSAPCLVFGLEPGTNRYSLITSRRFVKPEDLDAHFPFDGGLSSWLNSQDQPLYLPEEGAPLPASVVSTAERELLKALGMVLFLPLRGDRNTPAARLRGWVSLGPRLSGELYTPDDISFLAALTDQTAIAAENAQLLTEARRRADELIALQQTALDISAQQDIPNLLQSVVEQATRLLGASGGNVFLAQDEGQRLRLVVSHNLGQAETGIVLQTGEGLAGRVLDSGRPLRIHDYRQFSGKAAAFADAQVHSVLGVPLKWQEKVLGVLDVADTNPARRFTKEDEWLLALFADQAAIALRNAQLFTDLEQRVSQLDALRKIGEAVDLRQELDALLDLIYRQTHHLLDAENFYVALYDDLRQEFCMAYYVEDGQQRLPLNRAWPEGIGLTSQIVRLREPVVTDDYLAECERRGVPTSGKPARAWLGVPLTTGPEGNVLGVLNVSSFQTGYRFSQEQVELMRAIADQAAVAIDRMHLYQAMQDRAAELTTLNEVSRTITSTLDLNSVLELIMTKVIELLNVEAGSLLLVDKEEGDLVFEIAMRGTETIFLVGQRHPLGQGIVGVVAQAGESLIVQDAQSDPRWNSEVDKDTGFVTRSLMCVPMISRDEVVGVIEVLNHCDDRPFRENEVRLLEAFAAQAAITIENARLYTQTDQALAQRVEELSTMQRIDRELNATLDFERVVEITMERAMKGTGAPTAVIAHYDQVEQGVLLMASQGYPVEYERYRQEPRPLGKGIISRVIQSGDAALVPDVTHDPDYYPAIAETRAQLAVPIQREDQVIGVVNLESPEPGAFGEDDLAFVQRLADHAAIAIENAQLYQEVRQANQAKSEFIDFVAHELKQPMTAMQGYAKMLTMGIGGEMTEQQLQFVEVINSNVDRMGKLVNDLLEISRLEAGRTQIKLTPVKVQDVVQEVVVNTRAEIEARHHMLEVEVTDDLPPVLADRERLLQILTNLVSNAYKYTPDGGKIRIVARGRDGPDVLANHLSISVIDSGIGMSERDLERLEEKFFRAEHDLVRQQPGTGLGVSITRNLVELHDGEFSVLSEPDQGSTFSFTLPFADSTT